MEDLTKKSIEIDAWREGYADGLKEALKIVQTTARFGIDKTERGIEEELEKYVEKDIKRAS